MEKDSSLIVEHNSSFLGLFHQSLVPLLWFSLPIHDCLAVVALLQVDPVDGVVGLHPYIFYQLAPSYEPFYFIFQDSTFFCSMSCVTMKFAVFCVIFLVGWGSYALKRPDLTGLNLTS